jgi:phosphate-selective porin OprO/OprP
VRQLHGSGIGGARNFGSAFGDLLAVVFVASVLSAGGVRLLAQEHKLVVENSGPVQKTNETAVTGIKPVKARAVVEEDEGDAGNPIRQREDFQIKLRTNAVPAVGVTNSAAATNGFHWDATWQRWNGLHVGISQRTPLRSPREMLGLPERSNAPAIHLEQLKMSAKLGARVEVDGAVYRTDRNLSLVDDLQLRRLRLRAGGDCIILFPVSYLIELGYVPHRFNVSRAWFSSERINYIGYLKTGVFVPPMGLDMLTSSRDLAFMEPATALQALAPPTEAGIQIGHPVFNQRGTWSLGVFGGGVLFSEYADSSDAYGNLIARMTYLAIDDMASPDRPEENRLLHIGVSANIQYSPSATVRYRSRPESYIANYVIDTGQINARASGEAGLEVAYVNGPFCAQGEILDSVVREESGENLNFYGFYATASWYLTGESRPYDRVRGYFKRLIPRRDFDFGRGGAWGAFEISARFSHTDLTDGDVNGGRVSLMMGELNWYLSPYIRWMFNAGGGRVWGGPNDGSLLVFQTRVGVDF